MVKFKTMPTPILAAEAPKPPLGIIDSITTGFEVVNARLALALFPLALDLFLWLGPKLSLKPLLPPLISNLQYLYTVNGDSQAWQQFEFLRDFLTELGDRYNLFAVLSTAPMGVPSLVRQEMPNAMPPGVPATVWPVSHPLIYLALFGLFTLAGFFLGALYFGCIAQQVRDKRLDLPQLLWQVWPDWLRLTAFMALLAAVLGVLEMPIFMVSVVLAAFLPPAGVLLSALGLTLALWLVFYVGFTVQGIVLQRRGLLAAIWDSFRVVQASFPYTAGLYTVIMVLNAGLGAVWNLVAANTWVMLAALGGHALVSTALVAAAFAYYQDRYRWWTELRQARRTPAAAARAVRPKS